MFLRYVCVKQTAWTPVSFVIYGHDRCLKGLKTVRVVGEYKTHPVDHEWRSMRVFHAMFHYIFNKIIECDVKPCRWPERRCFADYFHIISLSIKPRGSLRIPLNHPSTPSMTTRNIKKAVLVLLAITNVFIEGPMVKILLHLLITICECWTTQ